MRTSILGATSLLLLSVAACGGQAPPPPAGPKIDQARLDAFAPLPEVVLAAAGSRDEALVNLGRMLYYEKRLSKNQQVSCNSCHDLESYGVDGTQTSMGHAGKIGDRNAPTVYNASMHVAQFWDGRAKDVEEQAKGPLLNPIEMAMPSEKAVVAVLGSMPEYVDAFNKAFPGESAPISYDNVGKAIGAFERHLVTPSRWDKFLRGDEQALTPEEKAGFLIFTEQGCSVCHAGAMVGAANYQKMGAAKPFPRADDPGRFKVTHAVEDTSVFKVPSLRNVQKTGPYFHDGKTATLFDAVSQMGEYQLGRKLSEQETMQIVTFLRTLTGQLPTDYIKAPALPPSTEKTPQPVLK